MFQTFSHGQVPTLVSSSIGVNGVERAALHVGN